MATIDISASAGQSAALSTTETIIYKDVRGCTEFTVYVPTGGAQILVHVDGLHVDGDFAAVEAGIPMRFTLSNLGIRRVTAKSATGTTSIRWSVTSKTFGRSSG